ncbi:MAG: hypothetical protein ACRDHE_16325 [Ktedonobacterales bacterium]
MLSAIGVERVTTFEGLREILGSPGAPAIKKQIAILEQICKRLSRRTAANALPYPGRSLIA